jgi:hypothetical protein
LGTGSLQQFIVQLNEIVNKYQKHKRQIETENQKFQYETRIFNPPIAEITATLHFASTKAIKKKISNTGHWKRKV